MKNKLILFLVGVVMSILTISLVSAATITIRPDGAGANKGWRHVGCSSGNSEWQCVDETTLDTSDYLRTSGTREETFSFDDSSLTSETINSVTMHYQAMRHNNNKNRCFETMTRQSGTDYFVGTQMCVGTSWEEVTQTMVTNPATGSAWTVSEVNALEAGMHGLNPDGGGRVAQVWAVVDYDPLPVCGNNMIEGSETCDGTDLGGETCISQGFDGGTLSCNGQCDGFVTTSCWSNTCSDTDGGNVPAVVGTTSGDLNGSSYSNDDSCQDASNVIEYFCLGDLEQSSVENCGTDTSEDVCISGNVYTNSTDHFCASGACGSNVTQTLKEVCSFGCTAGSCDPAPDSCSDTDGGINVTVFGTTSGYLNGSQYSNNDVCFDSGSVTEYYCLGTQEQSSVESCGTDTLGSGYCLGDSVYKDFTDYFCTGGSCDSNVTAQFQENCNDLDSTGSNYCSGGDVYRNITDGFCGSGACDTTVTPELVENCSNGCTNGACDPSQADLIVSNINFVETDLGNGSISLSVNATFENTGGTNAGQFWVRFASLTNQFDIVSSLNAGQQTVSTTLFNECTSAHNLTVTADVFGAISESDEGNNDATTFVDCVV